VAIDPSDTNTLYAGTVEPLGLDIDGVYKSTDRGASWARVSEGIGEEFHDTSVFALAIDPTDPSDIYAAVACVDSGNECGFTRIYKTIDAGSNWDAVLSLQEPESPFTSVVVDPIASATVIAGHRGDGAFLSTNGGESWRTINEGLSNSYVLALSIDPSTGVTYAGTQGSGVFKNEP
jgi:photosystem II stability/assembly factor-like uncharacterized protein